MMIYDYHGVSRGVVAIFLHLTLCKKGEWQPFNNISSKGEGGELRTAWPHGRRGKGGRATGSVH